MKVPVSDKEGSSVMENGGYSDYQLVRHFRSVLEEVTKVCYCGFWKLLWVLFNSIFIFLLPKEIKAGLLWLRVIEGIMMS